MESRKWYRWTCLRAGIEMQMQRRGLWTQVEKERVGITGRAALTCIHCVPVWLDCAQPCSLRPHGLQPTRLLCPWDSPSKNTAVSWHFLLPQGRTLHWILCFLHCRFFTIEPPREPPSIHYHASGGAGGVEPAWRCRRHWSLGREDRPEKGLAAHSSILAWKSPWTEEPGRLQSMGLRDWARMCEEGGKRWVGNNKLVKLKRKKILFINICKHEERLNLYTRLYIGMC